MRAIFCLFAIVAFLGAMPAAEAAPSYPWCSENHSQGDVTCAFDTFEQCLATVRGLGDGCSPNPYYEPPRAKPARARKAKRH